MLIQNQHIYLRALEPSDLDILYHCENDVNNWQVSNTIAPFSKDVLTQYLSTAHLDIYSTKQLRLMICLLNTNECVGTIDLFDFEPTHSRVGIGILVFENYRNNGYAKQSIELVKDYAFNKLLLNQLYCNISESNKASLTLFENCGFEKIGIKKQWNRVAIHSYEDEWLLQCLFTKKI